MEFLLEVFQSYLCLKFYFQTTVPNRPGDYRTYFEMSSYSTPFNIALPKRNLRRFQLFAIYAIKHILVLNLHKISILTFCKRKIDHNVVYFDIVFGYCTLPRLVKICLYHIFFTFLQDFDKKWQIISNTEHFVTFLPNAGHQKMLV